MSELDQIECDAAQWLAREDRGLSPGEGEELSSWLMNASHRVAYLRLKDAWVKSTRLAALRNVLDHRELGPARSYLRTGLAAAAVLLVLAGAVIAIKDFHGTAQDVIYATQAGERPTIHLVDGTNIQLDANSRLHATVSDAQRLVTLEKGEAYFEVVHDADRPFVVMVGKHRIYDLGTKFSVQKDGDDVRVIVTEGSVRVDDVDTVSPVSPVYATGGNVVVAKADETLLTTKNLQDLSDDLEWREGRLVFNQTTLADAAKQFNRYNNRKLVVAGAAREVQIGGSFRADNMDVFVTLVRNSLGLTVEDRGNTVVLSKK